MCDKCIALRHELTDLRMDYEKEKSENALLKLQMIKLKPDKVPVFYTVSDIAGILSVSAMTIRRLISTGQLSALKVSDGKASDWRISYDSLEKFILQQTKEALEVI